QDVVSRTIGGELCRRARPADLRHPHVHLDQIVEHRRREVLDRARAHDELLSLFADVHPKQPEIAVVLDAREVEVGEVAAVVDDALCVRVREADPRLRGEPERRLLLQLRITSSTSSRLRSIKPRDSASRLSRSSGSVFEGRTFMCQSGDMTERPSRCETSPSGPKRSFSSCSLSATSATGVLSSPVMKYRSRYGRRISESF